MPGFKSARVLSGVPRSMSKRGSKPRVADVTGSNRRPRARGNMSEQQKGSEDPDLRACSKKPSAGWQS